MAKTDATNSESIGQGEGTVVEEEVTRRRFLSLVVAGLSGIIVGWPTASKKPEPHPPKNATASPQRYLMAWDESKRMQALRSAYELK